MKKSFLLFCFILPIFGFSQPSHGNENYREFIRKFYYHLLKDDKVTINEADTLFEASASEFESYLFNKICDKNNNETFCTERGIYGDMWGKDFSSLFFSEIKLNKNRFTQGFDSKIDSLIDCCSIIYDERGPGTISIDLNFPNGKTVYFIFNRYPYEPIWIGGIYFENGITFLSILKKYFDAKDNFISRHLKRLAIINDTDGFTNIRKDKDNKSQIVGEILKDQLFYYTPNHYSNWWQVKKIDGSLEGYMHCSKIESFGKLSHSKWKKYESQMPRW